MAQDDKTLEAEIKKPENKLGLSKVVYAIGMGGRDSLAWLVGITVIATPVFYFFRDRAFINWLAKVPQRIRNWKETRFGVAEQGMISRWFDAAAVAFGLASLVSIIAHIPGYIKGPRKVAAAEKIYAEEVQKNARLIKDKELRDEENSKLRGENDKLKIALADARLKSTSMVDRVMAAQPSETMTART